MLLLVDVYMLFAYCVDVELPSGFVNRDAAREKEWTNKLVRNIIILVSWPDVNVMVIIANLWIMVAAHTR